MPHSCFCCCQRRNAGEASQERNCDEKEFAAGDSLDVEILNFDFEPSWVSTGATKGGEVKVQKAENEFFQLTRDDEHPWWNFSTNSDGKTLYVAYEIGNDQVSFKCDGEGVNKNFIAVVASTGAIFIKTKEDDKFLFIDNGVLGLRPTESNPEDMQWFTKPKGFESRVTISYNVEMMEPEYTRKWKSNEVSPSQPIYVISSSKPQMWKMKLEADDDHDPPQKVCTFFAEDEDQLFVTYETDPKEGLLLDAAPNQDLQSFVTMDAGDGMMKLQRSTGEKEFTATSNSGEACLVFCESGGRAARWEPRVVQHIYHKFRGQGGDALVFPIVPFRTQKK